MPKTLLVMRHCKSSWADEGQTDHERPLTSRGKLDAESVGRELVRRDLEPELVLCSTAKRARSTAKRVSRALDVEVPRIKDRRLYESSPRQCLRVLAEQETGDTILLIAHNPTLEELVQSLTLRLVALPTGAVAVISLPIRDWAELNVDTQGRLQTLFAPAEVADSSVLDLVG